MCIAIVQPANQRLTKEEAKASWDANSHGGGVAYIDNDSVKTEKVLDNFEEFWEMYNRITDRYGNNNIFVHFRIKTHGEAIIENTHPFVIKNGKYAVMHNGVISAITDLTSKDRSDTRAFAEEILEKLPDEWFGNPVYGRLFSTYIGSGSKVAIIRNDGAVWIINDKVSSAHYGRDGFWFSNYSYKPVQQLNTYYFYNDNANFRKLVSGNCNGVSYEYDQYRNSVTVKKNGLAGMKYYLTSPIAIHSFGKLYPEILEKIDKFENGLFADMLTNYNDWLQYSEV
jgi:hypothetical protein